MHGRYVSKVFFCPKCQKPKSYFSVSLHMCTNILFLPSFYFATKKVLRSCLGLLTKRGSVSSEEVICILANLGVSPGSLCRDKSALPILLSRSPASLFRLVAFLSSDAVRMPVNRIGPLFWQSECASLLNFVAPLSQKPNLGSLLSIGLFNTSSNNENNHGTFDIRRSDVFACVADAGWITGHSYIGEYLN